MAISIQEARTRFESAGITAAERYERGTTGKGAAWAGAKERAKTNYQPAMQEALSKGLYGKGLDAADANDFENGVRNKGVANWGTGLQAGGNKWEKRVAKFGALWGQALPTAQGPKRSANNIKRMTENVTRFVQAAGK